MEGSYVVNKEESLRLRVEIVFGVCGLNFKEVGIFVYMRCFFVIISYNNNNNINKNFLIDYIVKYEIMKYDYYIFLLIKICGMIYRLKNVEWNKLKILKFKKKVKLLFIKVIL